METRTYWPFKRFFSKLLDEQNGTHLHQDYQKELAEHPPTEEELRRRQELMQAALEEMEQANEEARRRAEAAEPDSTVVDQEPMEEQLDWTDDAPEENSHTEALVVTGETPETVQPAGNVWVSDLIGEDYRSWENGRVILDCGTGRGKNEFIIKKLASWLVDRFLAGERQGRILYLCPLNSLHAEMIRRRMEAEIAEMGEEAAAEFQLYAEILEVQTYQHVERLRRNNPAKLEEELAGVGYIVADECHYVTDFSTYNINTYLSLELLQNAERDHVVIYMSATGSQVYKMLNANSPTPPDRIYTLPQNYEHIRQRYFYASENLAMILNDLPADEKAVIFLSSGEDLVRMKKQFGDAAGYYCSENNPKYGRQFDALEDCIRDRQLQKRFLFTTKAIGMGIEIKDRTVKHIFIDQ